jgi:hypothetical protein
MMRSSHCVFPFVILPTFSSMFVQSTFTSRLNTNYVPSDSEVDEIRAALAEPLQQLSVLDERIARMQASTGLP